MENLTKQTDTTLSDDEPSMHILMAIALEPRQVPGDKEQCLASDQKPSRNVTKARADLEATTTLPVRKSGHKHTRLAMDWDQGLGFQFMFPPSSSW